MINFAASKSSRMDTTRKKIAILGSTGSIGRQTLDIIKRNPENFETATLVAGSKVDQLIEQARQFKPKRAIIADESKYAQLRQELHPLGIATAAGDAAVAEAMTTDDVDMVVTATVGYSGLQPTIQAIRSGKDIALANKETLVVAGELVCRMLADSTSRVIPVDSEHSAIYQCLQGEPAATVSRLIITASGGPFRNFTKEQLEHVTPADALRHPNWSMGDKITIDSATMLNKAFEIIEARWLFGVEPQQIVPVVHPQSIVHSMVEFTDGAVKAQLGIPDMHLPISYALFGAQRRPTGERPLTLADMRELTFFEPDEEKFPCITLAKFSLERGGNTACVVNAANEIANEAFRQGRIAFQDIYRVIVNTVDHTDFIAAPTLADYVESNTQARAVAASFIK
jgi:1-deoxy-D-xylulose-5-phosphate reductoisomerase